MGTKGWTGVRKNPALYDNIAAPSRVMEVGSPATSPIKGPCSLDTQGPTPATPDWCLQSFLPFPQTPIKHTSCFRVFLGWVLCAFFSFSFLFQILKKSPGLCGAPHTHCPSPHSRSVSRTFFFLNKQLTLRSQLALQNQRSCLHL